MDADIVKSDFLKCFEITNNPTDRIGIYFIRKWCENRHMSHKTVITPWLDELGCKVVTFNGTRCRSCIKDIPAVKQPKKQIEVLQEQCRYCKIEPIQNPIQVTGGYACKKCHLDRYSILKFVDVCMICNGISNCDETTANLYKSNNRENMRISTIKCYKCSRSDTMKLKRPCIYIWYCKDLDVTEEYVGKSQNMINRMISHKRSTTIKDESSDTKLYNFIRDHGGYERWEFNILETMPVDLASNQRSKWLREREKWWIERLEPKLNTVIPNSQTSVSFLSYTGTIDKDYCKMN